MCIYDKTPLPGDIEQPPHAPDLVIEVPAHLNNNAGVLVRDRLINNVFTQLYFAKHLQLEGVKAGTSKLLFAPR